MEIDGATVTTDYGGSGAAATGRATTATAGTTAMAVDGATGTATTAAAAAAAVMATATTGDLMDVETGPVATDLHYGDGADGRATSGGATDVGGAGRADGAPSRTRAWKNKKSGVQRQKEAAARRRQAAATAPDGRGGAGP